MKRRLLTFRIVKELCFLYAKLFPNAFHFFLSLTHRTFSSLTTVCASFKSVFEKRFTLQAVFRVWDLALSVFQILFFMKLSIQGLDCEIWSSDFSPCISVLFCLGKTIFLSQPPLPSPNRLFFPHFYRINCSLSSLIFPSLILLFACCTLLPFSSLIRSLLASRF